MTSGNKMGIHFFLKYYTDNYSNSELTYNILAYNRGYFAVQGDKLFQKHV